MSATEARVRSVAVPGAAFVLLLLLWQAADAIFAFAWNFADVIADKLRKKGWSGELFVPLPEGRIIEIRRRG